MIKFLDHIAESLASKLIFTIGLLIIFGVGVSWYALINSEKKKLTENAVKHTASYSDLIKRSISYDMLTSHKEDIQHVVESIGSKEDIKTIRILDDRGRIFSSSQPQEIGRLVQRSRAACQSCHTYPNKPSETLMDGRQWTTYKDKDGNRVLTFVEPIYNEPSCYTATCHVHSKNQRVLGILTTEFSLFSLDRDIQEKTLYITLYAAVFVGVTSLVLFLFLWRFIHKPVSLLSKAMQNVTQGDLDQRVNITSRDEMGLLGSAFNIMTENLHRTTVSRDLLIREIEERRQAEEKLSKSENFVSTAFESIRDPFIILDGDYRIVRANEACAQMRNIPARDLIGRRCHELFYKNASVCESCVVAKTFLSGERCVKDKLIRLPDGRGAWFEIYTYPVSGEEGKVSHVIEYFRDITGRKQAEGTLRTSREQLRNLSAHLQTVREEERTGVAREIHDELGQVLTALKMDLSWLVNRSEDPHLVAEKINSMVKLVDMTIKTVKRISADLRPGVLDDLGLVAAMEWYAEEFQKRTGILCDITVVPNDIMLDRDRSTAVFRVFQEALTNVIRHAEAKEVKAHLEQMDGEIRLRVEDNGKGISEQEIADSQSFGLIGMRERIRSFGGTFNISGTRNEGTTLMVSIPRGHHLRPNTESALKIFPEKYS
jgi:PAS domain S-box-containing protein